MAPAVFGDFLAAASQHLEAALLDGDDPVTSLPPVTKLYRVVVIMSRYCDDLAPCDEVEASNRSDLHAWERAVIDAGVALRMATDCLRRGAGEPVGDQEITASQRAEHLAAAGTELMAGRDLLNTHCLTDPAGVRRGRSDWAPVVTSLPILRALADEIARWSGRLAPFAARLANSVPSYSTSHRSAGVISGSRRADLASASQWLEAAGAAARPALDIDPVRAADAELLYAIPAARVPPRRRPGVAAESVVELCDGITVSASRLRGATRIGGERARWSPEVTSGGWQWMTQAAAVTSHLSELALRSLATRASTLASLAVSQSQLHAVADLLAGMRAAWHQVDRLWDVMITERKMLPTPAMTDASDLVLRIGRLAWDDPGWTPARPRRTPPRPPAAIAPGADAVKVVAAIHQAIDALAIIAHYDGAAVEAASTAGRLYVPTRSLSAKHRISRPFAPAPIAQRRGLREAYSRARDASLQAVRALEQLALATGAQSKVLALARTAATVQTHPGGRLDHLDEDTPRNLPATGTRFPDSRASTGRPGPVEQTIRNRGIFDPVFLLRAAAIDNAAQQLIAQAGNAASSSNSADAPTSKQHPVDSPAQLAAQSFPRDPAARSPITQPLHPASQTAGPASRVASRRR